jgi:hypothetical protein
MDIPSTEHTVQPENEELNMNIYDSDSYLEFQKQLTDIIN